MQNKPHLSAATGAFTPRTTAANPPADYVAHCITWLKHNGLTGAQALKRTLRGA